MHASQLIEQRPDAGAELASLAEILRWRAAQHPDRIACTFLADGETEEHNLTFLELDRKARAIAGQLQEHRGSGERALLFYPPGVEFLAAFCGCLYAGVVAVPAYPPRVVRAEDRSLPRIQGIVHDANPAFALTISSIHSKTEAFLQQHAEFRKMLWLATDAIDERLADTWKPMESDDGHLCFLQYTSGSTTTPRGVMVTNANILHNERACQKAFGVTEESVGV